MGANGKLFSKYYTESGTRKLHKRINKVKLDFGHARCRFKKVCLEEQDMARDEWVVVRRVSVAKDDYRRTAAAG
ncbi:MAG TPA: hypothetical protein DHW45_08465 [Candidatus Latescibacteria bacterium]|nr:hypothetical protein [Candidatus Latescibacterota bacterium]